MQKLTANKTCFGKTVEIIRSKERGTVTGFGQNMRSRQSQFFVEYTNALGEATERWFNHDELSIVE